MQTLNLDSDSNLWCAGSGHATKVYTAGIAAASGAISATLAGTATSIALASSTGGAAYPIDLVAALGAACSDATDGCCTTGNFNSGIAITRDTVQSVTAGNLAPANTNTVYIANNCMTGVVRV